MAPTSMSAASGLAERGRPLAQAARSRRPPARRSDRRPRPRRSRVRCGCRPGRCCAKPLQTAACAARGRSASASTIIGDLPPSSSTAGTRRSAAACATCLPVAALPVKKIMSAASRSAPRPRRRVPPPPGTRRRAGPAARAQLRDAQRRQRRVLRRLEHDRVAGHQRRDAVGVVVEQRPVPRPDHARRRRAGGGRRARACWRTRTDGAGRRPAPGGRRAPCSSASARACRRARCPRPRSGACRSRRQGVEERRVVAQRAGEPAQCARPLGETAAPPQAGWAARARAMAASAACGVGGRDLAGSAGRWRGWSHRQRFHELLFYYYPGP